MTIVKASIKTEIKTFIEALNSGDVTQKNGDDVIDDFADKLASVIENAIKSATVTIPTGGVVVATTGTAAAQTGANTTPAIGSLS